MKMAPPIVEGPFCFRIFGSENRLRFSAAANRSVVEADVAAAAVLQAAGDCIATSLDHLAAGSVSAAASNAAAVFGKFALAESTGEFAVAHRHAVELATNRALSAGEHPAEILQRCARDIVVTATLDFAAVFALLDFDAASGNDAPVARGRRSSRTRLTGGSTKRTSFQHDRI